MGMTTIWVIIAAVFLIIEIITLGLSTIWFTGGGIAAAVAAYMGASITWQIIIFIVVSAVLLLAMRPIAKKRLIKKTEPTNIDSLIGQTETVLEEINPGAKTGLVRINDVEWRAATEDGSVIPAGEQVVIEAVKGTKLYVTRRRPTASDKRPFAEEDGRLL